MSELTRRVNYDGILVADDLQLGNVFEKVRVDRQLLAQRFGVYANESYCEGVFWTIVQKACFTSDLTAGADQCWQLKAGWQVFLQIFLSTEDEDVDVLECELSAGVSAGLCQTTDIAQLS